jgi:parallel beta-helix repeat protein
MQIKMTAGVFALAVFGPSTTAWAADHWVGPTGNDAASGSQAAPWASIQHAVDAMQPGDSVTVADGSYAGFWMRNRQGDAQHVFTIRAAHAGAAKITGPSATASDPSDAVQLVSVSFAVIDGFDVTGASRAGISIRTFGDETGADTTDDVVQNCRSHDNGAGVTAGRHDGIFTGFARNVRLQGNEVDHNSEHGIYVSNSADNPVIRANLSRDNTANGLQINGDASTGGDGVISNWLIEDNVVSGNGGASAINLDGATFGTLRNNLVYGNARGGVALFMGDSAEASHDNLVVNNTVYDPSGSRFAIQIDDGADNNVVFNNVFWSAASGMEIGSVLSLTHDYNVVSSYSGGQASPHERTPAAATLFVGVGANDYHGGAALIAQGTGVMGKDAAPQVDLDGNARPQSGPYDIGCYQTVAAGSSPGGSPDSGSDAALDHDAAAPGMVLPAGGASVAGDAAASNSDAASGDGAPSPGLTGAGSGALATGGSAPGIGAGGTANEGGLPTPPSGGDAGQPMSGPAFGLASGAGGCNASSGPSGCGVAALFGLALLSHAIARRRAG